MRVVTSGVLSGRWEARVVCDRCDARLSVQRQDVRMIGECVVCTCPECGQDVYLEKGKDIGREAWALLVKSLRAATDK